MIMSESMPNIAPDLGQYQRIAIGVIFRRNQILISKRASGVHMPELWEFPGGKVKAGEESFQALYRELNEELGIRIQHAEPLICIPYVYEEPDKEPVRLLLDVWYVPNFTGRPAAKEKQPLRWVNIEQLELFPFPAANKNIIAAILLPDVYLITPDLELATEEARKQYLDRLRSLCQHGVSLLQIRFKNSRMLVEYPQFIDELIAVSRAWQARVQLNSQTLLLLRERTPDVYQKILQTAAQDTKIGIHYTCEHLYQADTVADLQLKGYRSASCHQFQDIEQANRLQLDFINISAVRKTTSHPQAEPLGWEGFRDLCQYAQMPVYALGGMNQEHLQQARTAGAQGYAAISALWQISS